MKCNNCGSVWKVSPKISFPETKCPFCGSLLLSEKKTFETLEDVLVEIRDSYGMRILGDENKLIAYFVDLAPQLRKQMRLISDFVKMDGPARIMEIRDDSFDDQCSCISRLVKEMNEEFFLDGKACRMICGAFYFVVTGRHIDEGDEATQTGVREGKVDDRETEALYAEQRLLPEEQHRKENKLKKAEDFCMAAMGEAQYNLGVCYYTGTGIKEDKEEAVRWYRRAAENGNAMAQYNLGNCYYTGTGIKEDKEEAVRWYRKAAEQGNTIAQYSLGFCYKNGTGIKEDKEEALRWYRKAAEQGSEKT